MSSMERKNLNRFLRFIESPYFNVNQSITDLSVYLAQSIKSGDLNTLLPKEEIWKQILLKKEDYNDLKFRKLCNDLLERFEKFLITEQLEKSNLLQANLLLNAIKDHKMVSLVEKQRKKSSRNFSRSLEQQSSDYFLNKYFFARNLQDLVTNYERKKSQKGKTSFTRDIYCLLYTSPSPRDQRGSRMPSSA